MFDEIKTARKSTINFETSYVALSLLQKSYQIQQRHSASGESVSFLFFC